MSSSRFVFDPNGRRAFRLALAAGAAKACYAIEGTAKENTPVHGDGGQGGIYPTTVPGEKPIGGTLRRSVHTVVYIDGQVQFKHGETRGSETLEDGTVVDWVEVTGDALDGIAGYVGTNVYYALFVHDGTTVMDERPFLLYAFEQERPRVADYFAAGFRESIR